MKRMSNREHIDRLKEPYRSQLLKAYFEEDSEFDEEVNNWWLDLKSKSFKSTLSHLAVWERFPEINWQDIYDNPKKYFK